MDVLHDRLIWQVLSGGHAFSPLRTDYRKTHASYPLGTASNPLGSAPALLLALIHRSAWNGDSRKLDFHFTELQEVRAKIDALICSRLGETRTAAASEVDLELAMLTGVVRSNAKERVTNGDTICAEGQRPWRGR